MNTPIPEALNIDGLELRGNYRLIGYRQDLLHAFERNHVAAYVLSTLLRWTMNKRDELLKTIRRRTEQKLPPLVEKELEIWIHMSFEEFADEFDGLFSHNTIKAAVMYLLERGVIEQRKNINPRYKDYEYRVIFSKLRKLLQALPALPPTRPRDTRNRKKKAATKFGDSSSESPNLVASPELANISPNLVDVAPELANHYTVITQESSQGENSASNADESPNDLPHALAVQVAEQEAELARLKALLAEKEHIIEQLQPTAEQKPPAESNQTTQQHEHAAIAATPLTSPTSSPSAHQLSKATSTPTHAREGKSTCSLKQRSPASSTSLPVIDEHMLHRIEEMYTWFDELRRTVTTKPGACYGRTASATAAIYELLASHPLPIKKEQLEQVYLALWNEPENKQTHYHQRNHMTIESVCRQFDRKLIALEAQEIRTPAEHSVGGYHYWKPPQDEDGELVYAGPKAKGKRG